MLGALVVIVVKIATLAMCVVFVWGLLRDSGREGI